MIRKALREAIDDVFHVELQVIKENCNHKGIGKFSIVDPELIMCEDCHRTFRFRYGVFGADEIKLGKKKLDELLKDRTQKELSE